MSHDAACEHERLLRYALHDEHQINALTLCEEHSEERRIALQHLRDRPPAMREADSLGDVHGRYVSRVSVDRGLSLLEARMLVEALRAEEASRTKAKKRKTAKNTPSTEHNDG